MEALHLIGKYILERNHINVMYVARPLVSMQALQFIEEFILERNHISVLCVERPLDKLHPLQFIEEFILERSWKGNMQEGQGSPNRGNRLQVSLKILCCYDDTWFHLNLTFLTPWAKVFFFLMEMFFLSYVNETMYLLWNLPFFKMVPPKTNFWLLRAQWTSFHINCFTAGGWHTSCHPISKMQIVGEGPGETPSALRCLSYLINNRHKIAYWN